MKSNSTVGHLIFFGVCVFEMATWIVLFPGELSVAIIPGLLFRKQLLSFYLILKVIHTYTANILEYFFLVFCPFISLTRLFYLVS